MTTIVTHYCATHGAVADASTNALVFCRKFGCSDNAAPQGVDPKEHFKAYVQRRDAVRAGK